MEVCTVISQLSSEDVIPEWKMICQMIERCNAFQREPQNYWRKMLKTNKNIVTSIISPSSGTANIIAMGPCPGTKPPALPRSTALSSTVTELSKTRWWHWSRNCSRLKCFSPKFLPDVASSKPITLASSASILLNFAKPFWLISVACKWF